MTWLRFCPLACLLVAACAGPLDDYVNAADPNYAWRDTGARLHTIFGGTGYVLNVTSQKWLDTSRATGPDGDLWTHQVVVIVPKTLKVRNVSLAYLTGGCNENPSVPKATDEDVLVADTVSAMVGAIAMIVFQIPNCPIVYPSDPSHKRRTEDAVIAWAWHEFLLDQDPTWLPRLPMTKAAMNCMRAVTEFTTKQQLAEIDGFVVAGASKRGWTTWMVGSVDCPSCPNIVAIAPLVPIVPDLVEEMHRMWMSYGGWTFAFSDYLEVNLTAHVDDPLFANALAIIDPIKYMDRLKRMPKMVVLSSDDEFMMFDWSNIWYDKLVASAGETHLFIVPDSEHSLSTGIFELLPALGVLINSVAHGITTRPSFDYAMDDKTGKLTVTIPEQWQAVAKVVVRKAHTLQGKRRDFRWVRLANEETGNCTLPDIALPQPIFGGNCIQPIVWLGTTLNATTPGTYEFTPERKFDRWLGYYIEVFFPSDTGMKEMFQFTTPGFVWPNTLPFKDCHGEACLGSLL